MAYVAFLRAVNVGGRGLVTMTDLQRAFETAGARNARTVMASGNVVFDVSGALRPVRERIQGRVHALLGAEPVIVFRSLSYLEELVEADPFGPLVADRTLKLYVGFLAGKPKRVPSFPLMVPKEMLEVRGLYRQDALIVSYPKKATGMYGFPGMWTEQELGVASTARNWSTVLRIAKKPA